MFLPGRVVPLLVVLSACRPAAHEELALEVEQGVVVSALAWNLARVVQPDGGGWALLPDAGGEFARGHEALMVRETEPAGCATATGSGETVAMSFSSCSRPLSSVPFSGTAQLGLDMSRATGVIEASGSLTGRIQHQALGAIQLSGDAFFFTGHGVGLGQLSWGAGHSASLVELHSRDCLQLTGRSPTGSYEVVTCRGGCPTGEGSAPGGVTVRFDGTPTATWTRTWSGPSQSGTVTLSCTP